MLIDIRPAGFRKRRLVAEVRTGIIAAPVRAVHGGRPDASDPLVVTRASGYDPRALASFDAFLSLDVRIGTIVSAEFVMGVRGW